MPTAVPPPQTERLVRVMLGEQEVWRGEIDAAAEVNWHGMCGVLRIVQPDSAPVPDRAPAARRPAPKEVATRSKRGQPAQGERRWDDAWQAGAGCYRLEN